MHKFGADYQLLEDGIAATDERREAQEGNCKSEPNRSSLFRQTSSLSLRLKIYKRSGPTLGVSVDDTSPRKGYRAERLKSRLFGG